MNKSALRRMQAFALSCLFALFPVLSAAAATLGPAETLDDLRAMLEEASSGDVLIVSGDITMDDGAPLSAPCAIRITAESDAVLRGLRLENASVTFQNILLDDSLTVTGNSHIYLGRGVSAHGSSGQAAVSFSGSGTFIIEPGCTILGNEGGSGVSISHDGGEFYGSIEGCVRGGFGPSGGAGVLISPLRNSGAVLISGDIQGGDGSSLGGHALNLYDLSGNAYVTVAGSIKGGSGSIGGDGIQIVSTSDNVSVGVSGSIKGGSGQTHGGNALILMSAEDSSSVYLSGAFSGGDAYGSGAQPGASLLLVGESAAVRARIGDCILEEGRLLGATAAPQTPETPEPTPEITPEPTPEPIALPNVTPLPEITAPADNIAYIITPEPPRSEEAPSVPAVPQDSTPEPDAEPDGGIEQEEDLSAEDIGESSAGKPDDTPSDLPSDEPSDESVDNDSVADDAAVSESESAPASI